MDADELEPTVRPRRQPVMSDVGRLAGVSHQTVSRVINGSRHVSPTTRERVLAAMRELDYRPNPIARALVTGRTRTIGVVSFDTTLYGPASTLFGIERAAHEAGYFIVIASLRALDSDSVVEAVQRLRVTGVDGVLVIVFDRAAAQAVLEVQADVPMVAVEAGPEHGVPVVAVDQRRGAILATRHLLDLGHATVHHIAGPADSLEAELRVQGWADTLRAAAVRPSEPLIGDWSAGTGHRLGARLARDGSVTAVFVGNDQMALGLLRALHEAGRRVPEDISVVGFDDIPEAPFFTPPLTTVSQDFGQVGSRSLRVLVEAIESFAQGTQAPAGALIPPELIVRSSSARAAH
ncbi:MAG: LacI family DNA-binding transcriptional regulator [Solirubrobacterales bacterium]|nr:LacI family DNA-binding transcriptional regulator [Solirubrobacterales bacterium]